MKFGVVNKSTTVNRFVLHTLQRNITHLAVITRKKNIKLGILKGGGKLEKRQFFTILYKSNNIVTVKTKNKIAQNKNLTPRLPTLF